MPSSHSWQMDSKNRRLICIFSATQLPPKKWTWQPLRSIHIALLAMLHCVTNLNVACCVWYLLNAPIKVIGAVPRPYVRCLACSGGVVFQCTIPLWFEKKKKDVREMSVGPLEHQQTMAQPHLKAIHHWLLFRGAVKSADYGKRAFKCNFLHL